MRDLRFRGLTTKGEMIEGSLVVANAFINHMPKQHTKNWIVTSAFGNGGWFNIRGRKYVKPETVGQFTGLIDKNGVDIYEGDIIAFGEDDIKEPRVGMYGELGAVQFCDDGARFIVELFETGRMVPLSDHKLFSDGHTCRLVTGNIHQTPELSK